MSVTYECLGVCHFQAQSIFVRKTRSLLQSGASAIVLGWKGLPMTNTLGYHVNSYIMTDEFFYKNEFCCQYQKTLYGRNLLMLECLPLSSLSSLAQCLWVRLGVKSSFEYLQGASLGYSLVITRKHWTRLKRFANYKHSSLSCQLILYGS